MQWRYINCCLPVNKTLYPAATSYSLVAGDHLFCGCDRWCCRFSLCWCQCTRQAGPSLQTAERRLHSVELVLRLDEGHALLHQAVAQAQRVHGPQVAAVQQAAPRRAERPTDAPEEAFQRQSPSSVLALVVICIYLTLCENFLCVIRCFLFRCWLSVN